MTNQVKSAVNNVAKCNSKQSYSYDCMHIYSNGTCSFSN